MRRTTGLRLIEEVFDQLPDIVDTHMVNTPSFEFGDTTWVVGVRLFASGLSDGWEGDGYIEGVEEISMERES